MSEITERNGKRVVIPEADELADEIRQQPSGQWSDLADVRRVIAANHGVDQCCPVTVQRLLVQFSESGEVPYWRVVDPEKPFAKRLVGGADRIREMLARERL
ncbi:MAG: hypothetical protein M9934_14080 [Thermomicrobiales bacterium]|nr:hypothetical protein [Thermomicrobiales bacterium]